MALLGIILSFLLFTYHSYSAPKKRFITPEYPVSVKEDATSDPRGLTHYSEEELKRRGLEFNPHVFDLVKANAESVRSKFDKTRTRKKGSSHDRVPVDAIIAYRKELKRNDELLEKDELLGGYPEDCCFRTCILY